MVKLQIHPGKNRLYVTLTDEVLEEELVAAQDSLRQQLDRLRPGFDVVNDISGVSAIGPSAAQLFAEIASPVAKLGVRRVVRVVGRSTEAARLFESATRKLQIPGAFLAFSREEAERMLDGDAGELLG